jgi:uncharacterized protein
MIKVIVKNVTIDSESNVPYVLLEAENAAFQLPIWIGILEASSIAYPLEGMKSERPMTHDLLQAILRAFSLRLQQIEIVDLKENTYYAVLVMGGGDQTIRIDCRPSDAIALALREGVPIYVHEGLIEKIKTAYKIDLLGVNSEATKERLKEMLEKLGPDDFGKYKM